MKTRNGKMKIRALALAVQGVLVAMYAMPAHADDDQAAALKLPINFVEIGVSSVSRDSAKFGEYTGLHKSGGYLIGNFDFRGGDAYGDGNGNGNGIRRWQFTGSDLGLSSRSVGATISDQGKWSLGVNFDQLTHYTSDSYQTPYLGSMGGNRFVLPAGFGAVATAAPGTRALTAGQTGLFHNMDIKNDRDNTSITASRILNQQWNIKADFNHLEQSGAKLMGFGAYGSAAVGGAGTGEKIAILPMPTNYKTDTVNLALNWLGDKGHATGSYFGSFFRDGNNGVQFQTFTGATNIQTMGTPPSNDFHQLNLTGGYAFSARTKLAGGLSYGRITQNTAYAYDTFAMVTPSPTVSLNGSVVTTHADLKLTDRTTKDLSLSAGLKYDNRDNRTSSNAYNFNAISGANTANYPSIPYSIKKTQLELAGDYRLNAKQKIRLAINHDEIDRKCSQYAVIAPSIIGGNLNTYPAGTNCLTATNTKEDKLGATYRLKAADSVNVNAGYSFSNRRTSFDQNAIAPMIGTDGNPNLSAPAATLIRGLNAAEYRGFHPFFDASRKQQMLKAGVNWDANNRLSVGASGRYTNDDYDSTYGMQKGHSWGLNLDATYVYREQGSISAYVTQQERTRDMTNLQRSPTLAATATVPSGATWSNSMKDTDTTIGLNLKQGGLMSGKLELLGDLTYSLGKTAYSTTLNYAMLSGLPCSDPSIYTCVPLPDIKSAMTQFKLSGIYKLDKDSKLALGYLYRRLNSDDFYYNGLQNGFTPTSVLPTNQTAPSYAVNMFLVSYIYNFR